MKKSYDPSGLANEIFRPDVAGKDLVLAITKMMNRIKAEQIYPQCLEMCNVTTLWKLKGSKHDFENYRGIFRTLIFRNILDRLMYNDEQSTIDANLTDCNVGSRKNRNICDNIFVNCAIMNSIVKGSEEPVDCQLYDIEKCFDSLWLHETINDLYEAGLTNDNLNLLFLENQNANIAVKTSHGMSERRTIQNIVMQGSVWGGLKCVTTMDKLGKIAYDNPDILYWYKGSVPIPPLQMVDDIQTFSKCSGNPMLLNAMVNAFVDSKKLTLSKKKCSNIHIGKQNQNCMNLNVHGSPMQTSTEGKYLGDTIHTSGKIEHTINSRIAKGYGAIAEIMSIMEEVPFGHRRIKTGLILRESKFLNGILFNSECWHNITEKDIVRLERLDNALLRGIIGGAHSKTPIEYLFLETGTINIRFILASRRILYLQHILKKPNNEVVKKVYLAQKNKSVPGDFYRLVQNDIKNLNISLNEEQMCNMSKSQLKRMVKIKCKETAFNYLKKLKDNHSKVKNIEYPYHSIQPYLTSPQLDQNGRYLLFSLRSRMVRSIRNNLKNQYIDQNCQLKCDNVHIDSQENLLKCQILLNEVDIEDITYSDIFSNNVNTQANATRIFSLLLDTRQRILEDAVGPVSSTGLASCTDSSISCAAHAQLTCTCVEI